jgi:glycosidase
MYVDDKIFGDLEKKEFLSDRKIEELKNSPYIKIIPEDPTPKDEIKIILTCTPSQNYRTIYYKIDSQTSEIQEVPAEIKDVIWDNDFFSFLQILEAQIPPLYREGIIEIRLNPEDNHEKNYYSFSIDEFEPPKWTQESIIYHIFVDRFAKDNHEVILSNNLKEKLGGNIKGIINHLDYIESLGINTIWLSPIFKSTSYHGYDIEDYFDIDPAWGNKEDLKRLVNNAFERGIRIILDFVPNHLSYLNPIFQDALNNKNSKYRNWFIFKDDNSYESFFGVKSMPKINLKNREARKYIIEAAKYWIKNFGISGYRLDYAVGPDINFWTEYYYSIKKDFPETFHFGEIVDTPEYVKKFIGKMDGVLDFYLFKLLREFFIGKKWESEEFLRIIDLRYRFYKNHIKLLSFLENHDSNRFLFVANDKRLLKIASILQFSLNEIPIIYNGQEMGANQYRNILEGNRAIHEYVRLPIPWNETKQDLELIEFYKKLSRIRKNHSALYKGDFILGPIKDIISFYKIYEDQKILIIINNTEEEKHIYLKGVFKSLLNNEIYKNDLIVHPLEGYILLELNH